MTHAACVATPCATGPGSHAPPRGVIVARRVSIPGGSCLVHHRSLNHGYGCGCGTAHAPCPSRPCAPSSRAVRLDRADRPARASLTKVCGTPVCNRASGDAVTRAVVRGHGPGCAVAPPVLVRGATMFLEGAPLGVPVSVSVGLANGCSYGGAAQTHGSRNGGNRSGSLTIPNWFDTRKERSWHTIQTRSL